MNVNGFSPVYFGRFNVISPSKIARNLVPGEKFFVNGKPYLADGRILNIYRSVMGKATDVIMKHRDIESADQIRAQARRYIER